MSTQFSQRLRKLIESKPAMLREPLMHGMVRELERAGEIESPDLLVISELFNALLSTQKRSLELYQKEQTQIRLDKDGRVELTRAMGESITIAVEAMKELGEATAIAIKVMAALTKAIEPIAQAAVKPETYTIPNYGPYPPFSEYAYQKARAEFSWAGTYTPLDKLTEQKVMDNKNLIEKSSRDLVHQQIQKYQAKKAEIMEKLAIKYKEELKSGKYVFCEDRELNFGIYASATVGGILSPIETYNFAVCGDRSIESVNLYVSKELDPKKQLAVPPVEAVPKKSSAALKFWGEGPSSVHVSEKSEKSFAEHAKGVTDVYSGPDKITAHCSARHAFVNGYCERCGSKEFG